MSRTIEQALTEVLGPNAVMSWPEAGGGPGPGGVGSTGSDSHPPPVIVAPRAEDQVAAVLQKASEEGWRVMPAGTGGLDPNGLMADVDILLTTKCLNGMEVYEPADLTFTAEAGMTLAGLAEATGAHGQWLPLDPPGGHDGTLGGVVSTAVPGPLRHLYGTARDHVLGLRLVSGDGRILRWGGRVVKNVAGFDVTRLVTGAWGTLGVVTSVSARLFPVPEADRTLMFSAESVPELLAGAQTMASSPLPLGAVELVAPGPLPDVSGKIQPQAGLPEGPGSAALALRLLGTAAQVEDMDQRARRELSAELGAPAVLSGTESRRFNAAHQEWEKGSDLVLRLSLRPASLPELFEMAETAFAAVGREGKGWEVRTTAHVGSGTLRVGVWSSGADELDWTPWVSAIRELRPEIEEVGDSVRISSGPDSLLSRVDPWGTLGPELAIARRLKAEFDPAGILAPGVLGL